MAKTELSAAFLLGLLMTFCVELSDAQDGLCAGKCGGTVDSEGYTCGCDTLCEEAEDCCPGYAEDCSGLCKDQCGFYSDEGQCGCDRECAKYEDCCVGYEQHCQAPGFDYGCHRFEFHTDGTKYLDARSNCESQDGRLAKLDNTNASTAVRNYIVENALGNDGFWIGLDDLGTEGSFVWSDATPLLKDTAQWGPKKPTRKLKRARRRDCVVMWREFNYKWKDIKCGSLYGYICEYTTMCYPVSKTIDKTR